MKTKKKNNFRGYFQQDLKNLQNNLIKELANQRRVSIGTLKI